MKKKIKISILIVFSLVFIFGLYILIRGFIIPHISEGDDFCPYKNEITILNDNYPSDIIIYGEEVEFDSRLKYRVINELSINSLTPEPEYQYSFLVINDRSGKLKISDEEFTLCKKICDEKGMNFVYIGGQYLDHLGDFGFHTGLYADDLRGIAYIRDPMGHHDAQGFWTEQDDEYPEENKYQLGQTLVYIFVNLTINRLN